MMEDRDDRLDDRLRDAARGYNAPPPTPKAEMWQRIQAGRRGAGTTPLLRSSPWRMPLALAAILVIGIAIGRFTNSGTTAVPGPNPTIGPTASAPASRERSTLASRLATTDHLSQAESFLTEFGTQQGDADFSAEAHDLLTTTRLLLDSKRVADPGTRQLLEDLEFVLVQITTLDPKDRREDLGYITEGLSQNHLRTRLRNAIPSGPIIRM